MLKVQFSVLHGTSVADRFYGNQNAENFIKYLFFPVQYYNIFSNIETLEYIKIISKFPIILEIFSRYSKYTNRNLKIIIN